MSLFGRWRRADTPTFGGADRVYPPGVNMEPPVNGFDLTPRFGQSESLGVPDDLLSLIAGVSGTPIARGDALQVMAVLRGRNMLCGIPATLPIRVHNSTLAVDDRNTIVTDPHPEIAASVIYAMTIEDLVFSGKAYWRVTRFSSAGFPVEGYRINLRSVAQHAVLGLPSQMLSDDLQFSVRDPIYVDGYEVPRREIIRFISPNPPLLKHAARAIRQALLLDKITETYANDPMPLGYFTDREDADGLEDEEVKKTLNDWRQARKDRAWGYVPNSLEAKTLQWDAEKIQLAEGRQHAVLDIARGMGIDPEDLGVSTTTRTYQNAEQRRMDLIAFTLMQYMTAIEQRLSKDDVLPHGLTARFDTSGFLRADLKTRMEAYKLGKEVGAWVGDEIRTDEHKPPLTPAQKAELKPAPPPAVAGLAGPEEERTNGNGRRPLEAVR